MIDEFVPGNTKDGRPLYRLDPLMVTLTVPGPGFHCAYAFWHSHFKVQLTLEVLLDIDVEVSVTVNTSLYPLDRPP